jgi:hypothetical protein
MWYVKLFNFISIIFSKLPLQTILAKALSWSIKKISSVDDMMKVAKSIKHCTESLNIMSDILEDAVITEDEIKLGTSTISKLKIELIEAWSNKQSAKDIEKVIEKQ